MEPLTNSLSADRIARLESVGVRVQRIGSTAGGRALHGCTIGAADLPLISIVAGAHPDEPAGPVGALRLLEQWPRHPLNGRLRLAVVPLLDIDGIVAQCAWLSPWDGAMDLHRYLSHRLRRQLGADREFAWPDAPWGGTVLPECAAANAFLDRQGPAIAHLSLHGMGVAAGAWFLLDELAMTDARLWQDLRRAAVDIGLHDSPRHGDKGFRRAGRGFCTTPSGPAMRRWALATGHVREAQAVAYGSMDAARLRARRQHAPPPLCAVSEFPLLRTPAADGSPPGFWRDALAELAMTSASPERCAAFLRQNGADCLPLRVQVDGMLEMCTAVAAAALRRYG